MKILYCSYSIIPSDTANSIAVMKQCAALSKITDLKVILIKGPNFRNVDYRQLYGVPELNMTLLPSWVLLFNEFGLKLFCIIYAKWFCPNIIYTRDIFLSELFSNFRMINIYEMHQLDHNDDNFDTYYKHTLKKTFRSPYLKKIICISNSLKSKCIEFGIESEKLHTLHSGVDNSECSKVRIMIPNFKKKMLVVYSGSIQDGKGVDIILKMAELAPQYDFLILGGAKEEIIGGDNIIHIPRVKHIEVKNYLMMADFLLLPLTEQKFKFHSPLKLFEYLSVGKVIVASDNSDIREIIINGTNGLLAKSGDAEDFIRKIDEIAKNNKLMSEIGNNALITAESFTWIKRAEKIKALAKL